MTFNTELIGWKGDVLTGMPVDNILVGGKWGRGGVGESSLWKILMTLPTLEACASGVG